MPRNPSFASDILSMSQFRSVGFFILVMIAAAINAPFAYSQSIITNEKSAQTKTISATAPQVAHVVLISVDGLRPDAITASTAPNLRRLIRNGSYCPKAQTIQPSITLPSHASMLTGLDYERHGVTWNNFRPGHIAHPTALSCVKNAGLATAILFAKEKFHYLATPGSYDDLYGPPPSGDTTSPGMNADSIADYFAATFPEKSWSLTFIHLREPDDAGHGHGWMSARYLDAVRVSDAAIGKILRAIRESECGDSTIVIVTADHGGKDRTHKDPLPENLTIPWICQGPGVPRGRTIKRTVRTFDTMPTILRLLGVPIPAGLDGALVSEVIRWKIIPSCRRARRTRIRRQ